MTNHTDDSLLQCLLALCRYHGSASTAEAIVGGLPLENGKLTPGLFERAAARVSLASRVLEKPIFEIEPALLPAVLLMQDQRACLLAKPALKLTSPDVLRRAVLAEVDAAAREHVAAHGHGAETRVVGLAIDGHQRQLAQVHHAGGHAGQVDEHLVTDDVDHLLGGDNHHIAGPDFIVDLLVGFLNV